MKAVSHDRVGRLAGPPSRPAPARLPALTGTPPAIIGDAGPGAEFAWEEFFQGEIANAHTRKNYMHAVGKFLAWCEQLADSSCSTSEPGDVGEYLQDLDLAVPTKKLHLAALAEILRSPGQPPRRRHQPGRHRPCRALFRRRRQDARDPAQAGRDADQVDQTTYEVESETFPDFVGLRDRAILAVLIYTAARVGAVARLTFKNLRHDGTEYTLRFSEKGGKSREIPVRHDLQKILLAYIKAAGITEGPLFRTADRQDRKAHRECDDRRSTSAA